MEVLEPAEIATPFWLKNILVVDNSGIQPKNVGHSYAQNYKMMKDTAFDTEPLASKVVEKFGDQLLNSGFYQHVEIKTKQDWPFEKNRKVDYLYSAPLSKRQVERFSEDSSRQLLLSLDALRVLSITHSLMSPEVLTRSTRDVWLSTVWRLYDLTSDTLMTKIEFSDSLYWYRDDPVGVRGESKLPPFEQVIPEMATVLAEKMIKKVEYVWVPVTREYFYTGSLRMRDAADWFAADSMERAAALWEEEFDKAHFRTKYRAAMNMMLYYEVLGKPELSLDWADKATKAMKSSPIGSTYLDEAYLTRWIYLLKERSRVQHKLKIYMQEKPNQ